jgi:ADP-dependent phosphofructokinase/glucokinase
MVPVVKEALDIGLDQVAIPSVLKVKGEVADRILCPPSGAIAVTALEKILLIDCRQQLRTGQWHPLVFQRGHP